MNHNMDQDLNKKMFGVLEELKEMSRQAQQRKDKKVWSEIIIPFTLYDGLNRLTRDELDSIRKRLVIKNASNLKKAELIAVLQEEIPKLFEKSILLLDLERYKIISKIVRHGGYIVEAKMGTKPIDYFRESGIMFTGTHEGKKILSCAAGTC